MKKKKRKHYIGVNDSQKQKVALRFIGANNKPKGLPYIKEKIIKEKETIKFCLIFVAIVAPLYHLYARYINSKALVFYAGIVAKSFGMFLQLFGVDVTVNGNIVSFGNSSMNIGPVCTNLLCLVVYYASVLAYPTNFKNKGIGILLGTIILYAVNIIRLGLLTWFQSIGPRAFDLMHHVIWPAFFIIFGLAMWIWWINYITKKKSARQVSLLQTVRTSGIWLFIGKFLLYCSITLGVWVILVKYYMQVLLQISRIVFNLIGFWIEDASITFEPMHIFPDQLIFISEGVRVRIHEASSIVFNIVPFVALILATYGVKRYAKLKLTLIGLLVLFILHLLEIIIQTIYAFLYHKNIPIIVKDIGSFILAIIPFILWIALYYRKKMFLQSPTPTVTTPQKTDRIF